MSEYQLKWITGDLSIGYASMSYDDLKLISAKGIDAIVNLCAEFCDLHEIEEQSGFEVYYLPIPDECAPNLIDMEKKSEELKANNFHYIKEYMLIDQNLKFLSEYTNYHPI